MDATPTIYSDRIIAFAKHSVEAARRQWRNVVAEIKAHRETSGEAEFVPMGRDGKPRTSPLYFRVEACKDGCPGCRELERIKVAIEALWKDEGRVAA